MTETALAHTGIRDSYRAGLFLGEQLAASLQAAPDVVIVFAAPTYEHSALLNALKEACEPRILLGCSSAGEFTSTVRGEGLACALALRSSELQFAGGVGRGLQEPGGQAAQELVSSFQGKGNQQYHYRTALVFADALAGQMDTLIEQLTLLTAGAYQFVGGGAGDNAQFRSTPVFYGTEVLSDAVVALEILSNIPLGIGVRHGWKPASPPLRVTEAVGTRLISVNAMPAVEAWQEHAEVTGQRFDPTDPLPFFLHTIIGIATSGGYRLRVPLSVEPDGSVICAAEIPVGAIVHLMQTDPISATQSAVEALSSALSDLNGASPGATLFFDCVATRLRMGDAFGLELQGLQSLLGESCYVGCNTHGQIARTEGQFNGFHNCTAVVCVIPA
jgi:hypothetical protein